MQTLNEKQIVIQNTKTGKQVIVTKYFFDKNKNQPHFRDFDIAITTDASVSEEPVKKTRKAKGEAE